MNRYPLWKYVLIVIALLFGVFYTLPNFFGESPAVQISSAKATVKVDPGVAAQDEQQQQKNNLSAQNVFYEVNGTQGSVRARFANTDIQFKTKTQQKKKQKRDPTD